MWLPLLIPCLPFPLAAEELLAELNQTKVDLAEARKTLLQKDNALAAQKKHAYSAVEQLRNEITELKKALIHGESSSMSINSS